MTSFTLANSGTTLAKRNCLVASPHKVLEICGEGKSEGDHKQRIRELTEGRDAERSEIPMAVGVAHPCIEAWLLADARAIKNGMELSVKPQVPEEPEKLPAPKHDRKNNPKTELAKCAGTTKAEPSSADKDKVALAMKDMDLLRARCPIGFAPFADEVEQRIKPLFGDPAAEPRQT